MLVGLSAEADQNVVPQLEQHFERQARGVFRNLIRAQDGAPAHRHIEVRNRLWELFGDRVVAFYHVVE